MSRRLPAGGLVDRDRPLAFTFDGRPYVGLAGDTLASALLANGVDVVAHSIYRDRPRGIFGAGAEEPSALVQLEVDGGSEPMVRATEVELFDGLRAEGLDGRGRAGATDDPLRCDKVYLHCDVLVIGGGPAGLAAADAAAATGARVILAESDFALGGDLLAGPQTIDGAPALEWVAGVAGRLAAAEEATVLTRATAVGYYDANYVVIAQRTRLWHVRARRVVLATGAHERPLVFADNDRPGIMLASAVRAYVERWAVAPGRTAVVATTNDSAYATAVALARAGVAVAAIADARPSGPGRDAAALAAELGVEVLAGHAPIGTDGDPCVGAVEVATIDAEGSPCGNRRTLEADLLAVSGGWNPAVELFSQSRGVLRYDPELACFVPDRAAQAQRSVGACAGTFFLAACLRDGAEAGAEAAAAAGFAARPSPPPAGRSADEAPPRALWVVPPPGADDDHEAWRSHFVDAQRDATVADLGRAVGAGLRSPEHVKRFTTIGTANEQGRFGGVIALGILAGLLGAGIEELSPTTFRPPYAPLSFGLAAGRDRGALHDPARTTSIDPWHVANGAVYEDVGQWKRPRYFPRDGEDMDAAVLRECAAARTGVAVMDASTLGKIDVQGPDAAVFLNRMYTGDFAKLAVGMCKYGVLCRADGMVFDDGVTMRLAEDRYLVTTTTGNAAAVLDWFEEWLQTEWPQLRVRCTSVTEQWATVAIVGPRSRDVLAALAPALAVDAESFPFMAIREAQVAGMAARGARISFSGELAFEVNVPSWHGLALWEAVWEAGQPYGITAYGTETMHVLRAEKGYFIVGQETDGTVTPQDLGAQWMIAKSKGDFVGKRSHARADSVREDRKQLVGLLPLDPEVRLPEGAQLVTDPDAPVPMPMVGHVTSSYRSAALGRTFALALVKGGRGRVGETVYAPLPDGLVAATITDPVFYDKEGRRRDG